MLILTRSYGTKLVSYSLNTYLLGQTVAADFIYPGTGFYACSDHDFSNVTHRDIDFNAPSLCQKVNTGE